MLVLCLFEAFVVCLNYYLLLCEYVIELFVFIV